LATAANWVCSLGWHLFVDSRSDPSRFPWRGPFAYQLDALAEAVLRGEPVKTTPQDAIENMTVVDAIYRAAGLPITSQPER
jgi:predicted dehydrogenase